MKSFTAKEFSRCPAKVYEAAREDGKVEVTHDRFSGSFIIHHDATGIYSGAIRNCDFMADAIKNMYDHEFTGYHTGATGTLEVFGGDLSKHAERILGDEKSPD